MLVACSVVIAGTGLAVILEIIAALTTSGFLATQAGVLSLGLSVAEGLVLALAGWLLLLRHGDGGARPAAAFGLAAGAVYAGEIALEYVVRPPDNTPFGYVEYGLVLSVFLAAGATAGWRSRSLRSGALAGALTGLVAVSMWLAALWIVFLAFRGTELQSAIFRAEGNFDDFKRSGMADFDVFVMGDTLGASIFHPLLNILFGAVLGTLGGGLARLARRLVGNGEQGDSPARVR